MGKHPDRRLQILDRLHLLLTGLKTQKSQCEVEIIHEDVQISLPSALMLQSLEEVGNLVSDEVMSRVVVHLQKGELAVYHSLHENPIEFVVPLLCARWVVDAVSEVTAVLQKEHPREWRSLEQAFSRGVQEWVRSKHYGLPVPTYHPLQKCWRGVLCDQREPWSLELQLRHRLCGALKQAYDIPWEKILDADADLPLLDQQELVWEYVYQKTGYKGEEGLKRLRKMGDQPGFSSQQLETLLLRTGVDVNLVWNPALQLVCLSQPVE